MRSAETMSSRSLIAFDRGRRRARRGLDARAATRTGRPAACGADRRRTTPRAPAVCRALSGEVAHAAVGIDESAVGKAHRHGVDREVTSGQIRLDVVAERDRRLAMLLGVDLVTERRDLEALRRPSTRRPCRTSRRPGSGARPSPAGRASSDRDGRRLRSRGRGSCAPASCRGRCLPRGRARGLRRRTARRAPWRSRARRARRRRGSGLP